MRVDRVREHVLQHARWWPRGVGRGQVKCIGVKCGPVVGTGPGACRVTARLKE